MNIVTIMNYNWNNINNINLCSVWINQAKLWLNKFDTVFIYSKQTLPKKLLALIDQSYNTCLFKVVINPPLNMREVSIHFGADHIKPISNHNFLFKLYVTSNISFPYLFIDADAFIVDHLQDLDNIFKNDHNRVFFIDHERNIPGETNMLESFINSGVFLMNDPEHLIYNWGSIIRFAKDTNFTCRFNKDSIIIPGTDQAIIKGYLDHIKYYYHHKNFGIEYNTYSAMINDWHRNKQGLWQTTLKNNPNQICKIVHYWGKNKPYSTKCPLMQEIQND